MAGSQVTRRGRKSIHREHQKEEGKHEEAEEEGERLRSRGIVKASGEVSSKGEKKKSSSMSKGRAAAQWLSMLGSLMFFMWLLCRYQTEVLPWPVSEKAAGVRGFSEQRALRHVKALTAFGPHPVGSQPLHSAVQYVLNEAVKIQDSSNQDTEVDVDYFHARPGVNQLKGGLFKGKSLVYSGLEHVVVRVRPKYEDSALENAILVSSHIDTVITAEGAGDCSSCVAVMLELARVMSQWAQGFKHSVIFLFNTGEEEGLDGAHSFMTQHPWRKSIRAAIDLEAMGAGGKHFLFQGGPDSWLVEVFAKVAKRPATMMLAQDIFHSGLVKSATDFQIYREVASLSGLDFAYMDNAGVYHTRNDKLSLVRPGSLQHSGDNLVPFLREVATSPEFATRNLSSPTGFSKMDVVYWDILGWYMLTYSQDFAKILHHSIIYQLIVLQVSSIVLSGLPSLIATLLAFLAIYLTWCFAIGFTLLVAIFVPTLSISPVPFLANPWLVVPLYAAPAIMGALVGHHFGHAILVAYLSHIDDLRQGKKEEAGDEGIEEIKTTPAEVLWEAERWLFKAGIMQWVLILGLTTWLKAGSSYLALAWVVGPTVAYGLMETRLSPRQTLRPLRHLTFWIGVLAPTLLTALPAYRFPHMFINMLVSFDRNPGGLPDWLGSVMIASIVATITTLILVYLLPYAHRAQSFLYILLPLGALLMGAFALVASNAFPAFTSELGRGINLVHVINTDGGQWDGSGSPHSFLSLSSVTMGNLNHEASLIGDKELICGRNASLDFATYEVKYGCQKPLPMDESLWNDRPSLVVSRENIGPVRETTVEFNAGKAHRWYMAINSNEVSDFWLKARSSSGMNEMVVPTSSIMGIDGWHHIQYVSGDLNDPRNFELTLVWSKNATTDPPATAKLLKLRTDINVVTPEAATMLEKLPRWCVGFGKSTSPYSLAYLATLPVAFHQESAPPSPKP